ncbi:MAG: phage Gp37/Gp68 family protein [Chromatiales bacterium]|nr:phage Gp37/Gp68 family protein [Chromatiales bacterium]
MSNSGIEWTERTWNPVTGCTKISAGCKYCYAEVMARRLQAMRVSGYENGFTVSCHEERLKQPLLRKTPTIYFINSMSDLFHPYVPFHFIDRVMETIHQSPQHNYQLLTKRPKIMAKYFNKRMIPDNIWLGVSVENKKHGLPRIPILREISAKIRFLSIEPLLEDLGVIDLDGIHWVIVGGESGHKARLMDKAWVMSIQKQCQTKKIPFFFKQWGRWGEDGQSRNKKVNGRDLDGKIWNEIPIILDRS